MRSSNIPASVSNVPRRLLVAGATGRLGEAVLNEAIARRGLLGFDEVVALVEPGNALSLGLSGLQVAPLNALPPIQSVVLCLSDAHAQDARSFHGRDLPFVLVEERTAPAIASHAVAAGAQRLVLVHPVPGWQQISGLNQGLTGEVEWAVSRLACPSMLMMRPVAVARSAQGNVLQRFAQVYLSLQMLMMPRSVPSLTSVQLARAVVGQSAAASAPGVAVMGAAAIQDWLHAH
jgi:hypothetical protein